MPTGNDWFGSRKNRWTPTGTQTGDNTFTSGAYAPQATSGPGAMAASEDLMKTQAADIVAQENQRYQSGLGTLANQYAASQAAMAPIDPSLLFSKAADTIGARGMSNVNALRSSLGARGLNPNSGAATGMLDRLMFQNQSDITGATRDVAIENQRQRQVAAAQNFANALNLANYTNAPVSGANLETTQNIYEGQLAKYGIDKQAKMSKDANKTNKASGALGFAGGLAKGLIPGL